MKLRRVSGPETLPVSVALAKSNGRIDDNAEDALVEGLIKAALAHVEKSCGLAFEGQVWEVALDAFPAGGIELPLGPVVSVASVKYTDGDGVEQTMPPDSYAIDAAGWVVPSAGWPSEADGVKAQFVAGAGTPEDVRQAILLIVEHWFENRAAASADGLASIPFGADAIISLHRKIYC